MDLRHALVMGRALMREHGLTGWTLSYDRAKTRAGACRFTTRQITLSRYLTHLHSEEEVRDTVLHEIAHALVGPRHGHDAVWRRQALAIGCTAERCVPEDAPRVEAPWVGICPAGHESHRHRAPTRVASCPKCARVFSPEHLLTWTHHGQTVPMHPRYAAELRRLQRDPGEEPAARTVSLLAPGTAVRVIAGGRYGGTVGRIEKVARTRYHVRTATGILTVPFSLARRLEEDG
ncbi:MAG: SprT-like domain-containing protein [Micrococcales bacterium]|nr:SprT-like domain-containing protein [Micrococcales bacterium]